MMDMYYAADQLQPTLDTLEKILASSPDVVLLPSKLLKVAHILVANDRFEGMYNVCYVTLMVGCVM